MAQTNLLHIDKAREKEIKLFSPRQKNAITGPVKIPAELFLKHLREYDEISDKVNKNEGDDQYQYYRAFMSTIRPEFLPFSKQIIRSWELNSERIGEGLNDLPLVQLQVLTDMSMTRANKIPTSNTDKYCYMWIEWLISRTKTLNVVYEKSHSFMIQDKAIEYCCQMVIDRLLTSLPDSNQYKEIKQIYLESNKKKQELVLFTVSFDDSKKQIVLYDLPYTGSQAFIEKANNKLLYILREQVMPNAFILFKWGGLPSINKTISKDQDQKVK